MAFYLGESHSPPYSAKSRISFSAVFKDSSFPVSLALFLLFNQFRQSHRLQSICRCRYISLHPFSENDIDSSRTGSAYPKIFFLIPSVIHNSMSTPKHSFMRKFALRRQPLPYPGNNPAFNSQRSNNHIPVKFPIAVYNCSNCNRATLSHYILQSAQLFHYYHLTLRICIFLEGTLRIAACWWISNFILAASWSSAHQAAEPFQLRLFLQYKTESIKIALIS